MTDILDVSINTLLLGGTVLVVSFVILLALWSVLVRALFSVFGKSKFYFVPKTLKELFLSVGFVFLLFSIYFAILFVNRDLLAHEFFKVWQILLIFSLANIALRVVLTGLDTHYRQVRDRSGIFRSVGLLRGTLGLVLYLFAFILSVNVLSAELGIVVTAILLFAIVLVFVSSFDQMKSIMAGLQLGDYYVEYGNLIKIDGQMGYVESIHGRSTVLRTIDGDTAVIPNSAFFSRIFEISQDDGNTMILSAVVKGKVADKIKERISGISSKVTMDLKEIPSEFKPKVFFSSVSEGANEFTIVFKVLPDSDIRKIVDSFCVALSGEFKDSLVSVSLK
ncbi:MAG TPA: mechanosensitive ion channel [Chromatiaceae bacterium]|nr:mechanosensitive ion channel [Chromatiaceae bacterium]